MACLRPAPAGAMSPPSVIGFEREDADHFLSDATARKQGPRPPLRRSLLDHVQIPSLEHFIDTAQDPIVPFGWSIEAHRPLGLMRWHADDVALWLADEQRGGARASGAALHRALKDMLALNATVLDYLFDHPALIPPAWEDRFVFFWGTIYRRRSGLAVRGLVLKDGILNCCARRLDQAWSPVTPAAIYQPR